MIVTLLILLNIKKLFMVQPKAITYSNHKRLIAIASSKTKKWQYVCFFLETVEFRCQIHSEFQAKI